MTIKRAFDICAAILALMIFSPVLIGISAVLFVFQGSPIFFFQERPGLNGKLFYLIKFRTMTQSGQVTGMGKILRSLSLDELPELINILFGQMSFVGPRPLLQEYLPFYNESQLKRHSVKPGLTGLAQVRGRNSLSWQKKYRYDLFYCRKKNFWFDLQIIIETIFTVLRREGVDHSKDLTMPKFSDSILMIGAGGHAKVIIEGMLNQGYSFSGILDDDKSLHGKKILGVSVLGGLDLVKSFPRQQKAIIGIGLNKTRKDIAKKFDLQWISFIHSNAHLARNVRIGRGSVVFSKAHIGVNSTLGEHVVINTGAQVDHDGKIGNYCHLAPAVSLCGTVHVGDETFLGVGAQVAPNLKIGQQVTIAAGSTVLSDVATKSFVLGTPAKVKTYKEKSMAQQKPQIQMAGSFIDEDEKREVLSVFESGRFALGEKINEFEAAVAKRLNVKHAIANSSGTASLHMIVRSLALPKGSEVLVPSFTFAASVNVILMEDLVPVFVDIDPVTYCLSLEDCRKKLSDKTKAILSVDVFGHPIEYDLFESFCQEHNLKLICDSCEAMGSLYKGKPVGGFGVASSFGFYPNKQICTGEGGMIVTNDDHIASVCRSLLNQGRGEMGQWLEHIRLGYNYRMSELQAAMGVAQMRKLDKIIEKRSNVASWYQSLLSAIDGKEIILPKISDDVFMSWFVYVVRLKDHNQRAWIMKELNDRSIPTRTYFTPIHQQPYMKDYTHRGQGLTVTELVGEQALALPFAPEMTHNEVLFVVENFIEVLQSSKQLMRSA